MIDPRTIKRGGFQGLGTGFPYYKAVRDEMLTGEQGVSFQRFHEDGGVTDLFVGQDDLLEFVLLALSFCDREPLTDWMRDNDDVQRWVAFHTYEDEEGS